MLTDMTSFPCTKHRLVLLALCALASLSVAAAQNHRPLVETLIAVPKPVSVREGLAELPNGAKLWYWDTGGSGAAIVLAHPGSGNHRSWMYQQPVFAQAGYRVIGYSRRGFYQSDAGPQSIQGTQADDLALLLDFLKIDRIHVIGAAAGGITALDFALGFPERTLSATVVASTLGIQEDDYSAAMRRTRNDWFDSLPPAAKELSLSFRATYPDGVALWEEIFRLNPPRPAGPPVFQPTRTRFTWELLAKNPVPMLMIVGGADLYVPPELFVRASERIASSQVVVFPSAGHAIFAEEPDKFNEVVLGFIGRH